MSFTKKLTKFFKQTLDPLDKTKFFDYSPQKFTIDPSDIQELPDDPGLPPDLTRPEFAPPLMPTPDDTQVKRAKRRKIAELFRRRGRASTILTDPARQPLGG